MALQWEQLRTFAVVVEGGTLEAAARSLHVTPSAVSQRLKALEDSAGQVLLQRTNPVQPTVPGEAVLRLARQVQLLEAEMLQDLDGSLSTGHLSIPLVVNADSLSTWFIAALAGLSRDFAGTFDLHREDEKHSTDLLRSGTVMAAVTANPQPVQGCTVEPLGAMRYRAVASPEFISRWWPDAKDGQGQRVVLAHRAPVVYFDRKDELQAGFFSSLTGQELMAPRHYVPASMEFAQAIRLGLGWGLLPEQQCLADIQAGALTDLAPEHTVDVALYWQRWKIDSQALDQLTAAVRAAATRELRRPDD